MRRTMSTIRRIVTSVTNRMARKPTTPGVTAFWSTAMDGDGDGVTARSRPSTDASSTSLWGRTNLLHSRGGGGVSTRTTTLDERYGRTPSRRRRGRVRAAVVGGVVLVAAIVWGVWT